MALSIRKATERFQSSRDKSSKVLRIFLFLIFVVGLKAVEKTADISLHFNEIFSGDDIGKVLVVFKTSVIESLISLDQREG